MIEIHQENLYEFELDPTRSAVVIVLISDYRTSYPRSYLGDLDRCRVQRGTICRLLNKPS